MYIEVLRGTYIYIHKGLLVATFTGAEGITGDSPETSRDILYMIYIYIHTNTYV